MSLIHEALKKVERQRQLGKAPTLESPAFQRPRKRRWRLPGLALAVVIASVCLLWLWRTPAPESAQLARVAPPASAPGSSARSVAPVSVAAQRKPSARVQAQPEPGRTAPGEPIATAAPQSASEVAAVSEDQWIAAPEPRSAQTRNRREARVADPQAKPTQAPSATPPPRPKPVLNSAPPVLAPLQAEPLSSKTLPSKTLPAEPLPAKPPAPGQEATTKSKPAPGPAGSASAPPMYWDLPYAERRDLPAFHISMHVFAEQAVDRFVILNGERQVEGDELPNGIKLVAIRADGIVLEADGKRFMVPRDGGY